MAEQLHVSENKIFSADGGPLSIDGFTVDNDLEVKGDLVARGAVATEHDAIYWFPADFVSTGTRTTDASSNSGVDRIPFAATGTNRLKFTWVPPIQWEGREFTYRIGWVKEASGSGDVEWEVAQTTTLLGGNFTSTATALEANTRAVPSGGALAGWDYFDAATFEPTPGAFGEMPFIVCQVRRLGDDAADTYADVASVFTVTATAEPVA